MNTSITKEVSFANSNANVKIQIL